MHRRAHWHSDPRAETAPLGPAPLRGRAQSVFSSAFSSPGPNVCHVSRLDRWGQVGRGGDAVRLSAVRDALSDATCVSFAERAVAGVAADSREARQDWLFVAVSGATSDGHDYIGDAVARGVCAIVAERRSAAAGGLPQIIVPDSRVAVAEVAAAFYGYPSEQLSVSATTGTDGKSSITVISAAIARAAGKRVGVIGTIAYQVAGRTLPAKETTPGPVHLQSLLAQMAAEGVEMVFMEASSHGLDQRRLHAVALASALHSVVTEDHLEYHEGLASYRRAKARLFEALEPSAFAVLNADDRDACDLFARVTRGQVVTYGIEAAADYRAEILESTLEGSRFRLTAPDGSVEIRSTLIGKHNVQNCLAAAANASVLGIGLETIRIGIESVSAIPGRLERVSEAGEPVTLIDYAHTAHALRSVLLALQAFATGRIILAFGCGGDRDRGKRPKMGRTASELADVVWVTSDNPRSESPEAIIEDILRGVPRPEHCRVEPDRRAAIEGAVAEAEPSDIVLITGKGHEAQQIFKDHAIPFSDADVARRALNMRRSRCAGPQAT